MNTTTPMTKSIAAALCAVVITASGCRNRNLARWIYESPSAPMMLGAQSDEIWMKQEVGAEASDFVVYQHEFNLNTTRLNMAGEDHVKEIASRLIAGQDFPVVIERSMTAVRENTEFEYPVHPNPELDMQRRAVIVRALAAMGVTEVEPRVLVAPAMAEGVKATEAEAAYINALNLGDGVGGGGGFGGFGGFGFGGF